MHDQASNDVMKKNMFILLLIFLVFSSYAAWGEERVCPSDMVKIDSYCIDMFEAPNEPYEKPLVMFSFVESEAWCENQGKRLCYDDEWTKACKGPEKYEWSYGDNYKKGYCNTDKIWKRYSGSKLGNWKKTISTPDMQTLDGLFYKAVEENSKTAAEHVLALYQADPSGDNIACFSTYGVYDLIGNVEEWTQRRNYTKRSFRGNLKGRFWAEPRSCSQSVKNHGDLFRFYEIGFRCCKSL